jgi:hypothetical protein
MFFLFDRPQRSLPKADVNFLAGLEGEGEATINNVILSDSVLRELPYAQALDYISLAARRFQAILSETKPDVVLSGYDGFQSTLCMLVCRDMDIPWFALTYLPIPYGMTGFSSTNNSKAVKAFGPVEHSSIREHADLAISAFQKRSLVAHVPETENSLRNIFKFVPLRFRNFTDNLASAIGGRWDRFTRRSVLDSTKDYLRRRRNYLLNKSVRLVRHAPKTPFAFFGFHMQPEMGLDVWAPFYSDQLHVIDCISRALPPTHRLFVKLHPIDSDNWSNAELVALKAKPGVDIVAPDADTYEFVRQADIVFSIQGTIALEASLLGRQVITFGETMYEDLPTVTRVLALTDLPRLVRNRLTARSPTRLDIQQGLERLLTRFRKGLHNNWDVDPTDSQMDDFCNHLNALQAFLQSSRQLQEPRAEITR